MSLVFVQTTTQFDVKFQDLQRWTANCFTIKKKQTLSKLLRDTEGHLSTELKPRISIIVGSRLATEDNVRDHSVNLEIIEASRDESNQSRTMIQHML